MRLHNIDLNLLVTLQALLRERSVTRAAERLGLSQPAVSAALGRLRRHFDDDLLARSGNNYLLTPLAEQLVERTDVAVADARRVFASQEDFDPATARREFTVLMSDYALSVLGGPLSRLHARLAPHVALRVRALNAEVVDQAEETLRGADAIVMPHGFVRGMPYRDLFRDDWVCLVAADNDRVGDELSTAQLAQLPWVVTYGSPTAFTTASMQMRVSGIEPQVQMAVESFAALPTLVAGTERIALVQRRLAEAVAGDGAIRILPCPFDPDAIVEALWWHPLNDRDSGHRWLRSLIAQAAEDIDAVNAPHH